MLGREPAQVSWGLSHLLGVHLDGDVLDMRLGTLGKSQAVVVHRQSRDLLAGQACTAPVQGCEWAVGQNGAHLGLDAGGQAGLTSPEH